MRTVTAREANQSFSKMLGEVEDGKVVRITRRGKPVARLVPEPYDRTQDPAWQAARDAMLAVLEELRNQPDDGFRVGEITEEDKRGRHR